MILRFQTQMSIEFCDIGIGPNGGMLERRGSGAVAYPTNSTDDLRRSCVFQLRLDTGVEAQSGAALRPRVVHDFGTALPPYGRQAASLAFEPVEIGCDSAEAGGVCAIGIDVVRCHTVAAVNGNERT